jgi:hypothetical protein
VSGPSPARIGAIDLTRGALMILIVCAHATFVVEPGHPWLLQATRHLLSGTVGFTTVSGMLVGWFAVHKRDRWERVTSRYRLQAFRLLLIAHPLMSAALLLAYRDSLTDHGLRTLFITDTLAVLFLLVVPIIPRTSTRARLIAGLIMVVGDAFLDLWHPPASLRLVYEVFCGIDPTRPHVLLSDYALLPLGGMFLIGTCIGELYGNATDPQAIGARLSRIAAWLSALGGALVGAWLAARQTGHHELARLLYPDFETTLYPIYVAWTLVIFTQALQAPLEHPIARWVVLLGRTSLFVYVAQYFVVETIPALLGWRYALSPWLWPLVCAGAVAILIPSAGLWRRWRASVDRGTR